MAEGESFYLERPTITFDDVCGLKEVKDVFVEKIVIPLKFPHLFKGSRSPFSRAMMVFGAPGTGIALYPRAAANMVPDCSVIHRFMFDFTSQYPQDQERSIVEIFNTARNNQPCVVILDSFESVQLDTESEREGVERRLLTEILVQLQGTCAPPRLLWRILMPEGNKVVVQDLFTEARNHQPSIVVIDEFESCKLSEAGGDQDQIIVDEIVRQVEDINRSHHDIFVVFVTHAPQHFPKVIRRRCYPKIYIPMPNLADRRDMLKMHLLNTEGLKTDITNDDIEEIAVYTDGFTGADISLLCRESMMEPVRVIQSAQYYKQVTVNEAETVKLKWTPCAADEVGAEKMTWTEIESSDDLLEQPITMNHLRKALRSSRPSIREEDLKVYHDFVDNYSESILPVKGEGAKLLQIQCKTLIQKVLTLDRMDAVMDLPLPRRLRLFLLSQDEKVEGHPEERPSVKDLENSQENTTEEPT